MSIEWTDWGTAAFERARSERKAVLLSIVTAWSGACAEMDRTSFADARVSAIVAERFIPLRVDADRRPDIAERYGLGGWPTTAFLSPGGALLGGGTYVDAARLPAVLERAADAYGRRTAQIDDAPDRDERSVDASGSESLASLTDRIFATFDRTCGGFGLEPKFPHAAPVLLALAEAHHGGRADAMDIAVITLDAMGWGALYDEVDGGFFRCAATRDWREPSVEKLLDVNAAMLDLYVAAWQTLGLARYRERAEDVLRFTQSWLADVVDGGWGGSLHGDAAFYATPRDAREGLPRPALDGVIYTDANAAMVSASLHAAAAFEDPSLQDFAIKSLERVALAGYRPGRGVAHYVDDEAHVRGLLHDQIAMAAAHLDAFDATGNIVYEMMAEELAHYALRTMWDHGEGGFFDREDEAAAVGRLRRRHKPFVANCQAVRMLRRLAASSGDPVFADAAERTVPAIAGTAASQGPLAADYVLALSGARVR